MKNYFEHEEEVQFVDGILSQNQEWQWFIDMVEANFDLEDISEYGDYLKRKNYIFLILGKFIKIVEICDKEPSINNLILKDLFRNAQFSLGVISETECQNYLSSNVGKIVFLVIWITKCENSDNNLDFLADARIFEQKNFHQAIIMDSILELKDDIMLTLESIRIDGFDDARKCIIDNINQISYDVSEGFFERYKEYLFSPKAFGFQLIQKEEYLTWQENVLLDMVSTSIFNKKIVNEYATLSSDYLNKIKSFFNNDISDFVIESIDYIENRVCPSNKVVFQHCILLRKMFDEAEEYEIFNSSYYSILSSMFKDGTIKTINKGEELISLIKRIQKEQSIDVLLRLKNAGFPLSKDQNHLIKSYIVEQYKMISNIEEIHFLIEYFKNVEIAKHITQEYYDMIFPKISKVVDNPREQLIPTLFYHAMLFLIEVNQTNASVNKRKVKIDMIRLQDYWEKRLYAEQCKNLQSFKYGTSVKNEDIEKFNDAIIANPILIAQKCLYASTDDMVEVMKNMSENVLIYMVKRTILSPIYPMEDTNLNYDNHEIDSILRTQIERIKEKYGYKFLNKMDTDTYLNGIHERFKTNASITIPMFNSEEKLYQIIENEVGKELIPYDEKISLGHITQLFPLLEIQIRNLGKMFGIVPFKENKKDFMKYKDPSSILRELLDDAYNELGSFENVPDLLFVYHFMYNGNSLNIRNECIHGRNYVSEGQLRFAFKITLLSLYMIIFRKKIIEENIKRN